MPLNDKDEFDFSMRETAGWMTKGWLLVILAVVMIGSISVGIWFFEVGVADIKGRGEARKQITSAEFRLTAYNMFFDRCVAIQNAETGIDSSLDQLATAESPEARERINANIAGFKQTRHRSIQQYNADAKKDYTVGNFRDNGLPYQIDDVDYNKKGDRKTSCK